jgi:hypothetical protein
MYFGIQSNITDAIKVSLKLQAKERECEEHAVTIVGLKNDLESAEIARNDLHIHTQLESIKQEIKEKQDAIESSQKVSINL